MFTKNGKRLLASLFWKNKNKPFVVENVKEDGENNDKQAPSFVVEGLAEDRIDLRNIV